MNLVRLGDATALDAWQPMKEALITCFIFDRTMNIRDWSLTPAQGRKAIPSAYSPELVEIWQPRTYHVWREGDGWKLDVGEGGYFSMESWDRLVQWFDKMHPLHIEVLIDV